MSAPIDPPRPPPPGIALALAEATLQRQSSLLGAGRNPTARASDPGPGAPENTPPTSPVLPDRVSLSPQALQAMGGKAAGAGAQPTAAGAATAMPGSARPSQAAALQLLSSAPAAPAPALPSTAWPASGVSAPVQALIGAMVQNMTRGGLPQRVVSIQPWSAELVRLLEDAPGPQDDAQDRALPPLQTWLVRQGSLQTTEGARSFTLILKAPVPWLQQQHPPSATSPQGEGLSLAFTGRPQALQRDAFALVLQSTASETRTSALLVMEFAPLAQAAVYGRDMLQARQDPWLQMAVLQASGQLPRDEDLARHQEAGLCQTPGCPYAGRATCPQPFCPALRVVSPVTGVDGGAGAD